VDPQACLNNLLELYKQLVLSRVWHGWQHAWESEQLIDLAIELGQAFEDLYEWLARGGFPPTLRIARLPRAVHQSTVVQYFDERGELLYDLRPASKKGLPSEWLFVLTKIDKGIPIAKWQLR
jgi:hypothetical protein